jgi:hypothetical protein
MTRYPGSWFGCAIDVLRHLGYSSETHISPSRKGGLFMAAVEKEEATGERGGPDRRFCPYCFMQQFEVTDTSEGSVYCEVCGIDILVRELARL